MEEPNTSTYCTRPQPVQFILAIGCLGGVVMMVMMMVIKIG